MLRTILVPLDGSRLAERAISFAAGLARAAGGRLLLLQAVPPTSEGYDAQLEALRAAAQYLASIRAEVGAEDGVRDVEMAAVPGEAAPAILAAVSEHGAGSIVMATHGRSGVGRWLYGSVADHVLRTAPVPVMLVPASCERSWLEPPPERSYRLLLPLDGSQLAELAVPTAQMLAATLDAEVTLLGVVEPPHYAYAEGYSWTSEDPAGMLAEVRQYLDGLAAMLRHRGHRVTTRTEFGIPASTIATVARESQSDLIVMATHGRSGVARVVLGSVTTGLLHETPVPLVLVRSAISEQLSNHAGRTLVAV